jgi:acyl-CoA reductase-like NAD-dependent aldehyde dehydrogenase
MQKIIEESVDPSCYSIVQGAIPETQALLAERWDKIFFTGGANVGRIIAKAAAPHLTPVVLELGGMNPAIVTASADPRLVARRMLWGKLLNAGQLCTSQNYLLVDKALVPQVIEEFKVAYKEFYPNGAKNSPDYSRIVNPASFARLKAMLDGTKGKILMGGTMDEKELFIEPTVVQIESVEDSLCTQESFGPFIPILPVENLDEAIRLANGVQSTPLGLYPFGNKADVEKSKFLLDFAKCTVFLTNPQLSPPPAPVVSPATMPLCTSPLCPSVVSVSLATVPTVAAPASMSGSTAAPSPPPQAGWRPSWPSATRLTPARSASGTPPAHSTQTSTVRATR